MLRLKLSDIQSLINILLYKFCLLSLVIQVKTILAEILTACKK